VRGMKRMGGKGTGMHEAVKVRKSAPALGKKLPIGFVNDEKQEPIRYGAIATL